VGEIVGILKPSTLFLSNDHSNKESASRL
jgi:hypothetical protein